MAIFLTEVKNPLRTTSDRVYAVPQFQGMSQYRREDLEQFHIWCQEVASCDKCSQVAGFLLSSVFVSSGIRSHRNQGPKFTGFPPSWLMLLPTVSIDTQKYPWVIPNPVTLTEERVNTPHVRCYILKDA